MRMIIHKSTTLRPNTKTSKCAIGQAPATKSIFGSEPYKSHIQDPRTASGRDATHAQTYDPHQTSEQANSKSRALQIGETQQHSNRINIYSQATPNYATIRKQTTKYTRRDERLTSAMSTGAAGFARFQISDLHKRGTKHHRKP